VKVKFKTKPNKKSWSWSSIYSPPHQPDWAGRVPWTRCKKTNSMRVQYSLTRLMSTLKSLLTELNGVKRVQWISTKIAEKHHRI